MPRQAKRSSPRRKASGRGGGKRSAFALFALSTLVFILFSLIVLLILIQKPPVDEDAFAPSDGPWEAPAPTAAAETEPPPEEAPSEEPVPADTVEPRASIEPEPASPVPAETPARSPKPSRSPKRSPAPRRSPKPRPEPSPARTPFAGRPQLVIVIADVGHNSYQLEPFLNLPFEITFAVLPGLPHTEECVKMLKAAGKEYILHMPMEAIDGSDPGPGAIRSGMSPREIHAALDDALERVPGAAGMNNHMGSTISRDLPAMRHVLRFAKQRGIYYLDSRTISGSVAGEAAELEECSYWERDVFLDNAPDKESLRMMMREGTKVASATGRAVMIGHVWSAELAQTLMELYPELVEEGYDLAAISRIMREKDDEGPGN